MKLNRRAFLKAVIATYVSSLAPPIPWIGEPASVDMSYESKVAFITGLIERGIEAHDKLIEDTIFKVSVGG
jgi:energy-converting hydrogenase Eha subunit A